jgi:hypothetical protein
VTTSETRLTLSTRPRPFQALVLPQALLEGKRPQTDVPIASTEGPP